MTKTSQNPKALATRLRVFRFAKEYMSRHRRAPSAGETAAACDLDRSDARRMLNSLDGADGLDHPTALHTAGHGGHIFADEAGQAIAENHWRSDRAPVDTYINDSRALHEGLKTVSRDVLL